MSEGSPIKMKVTEAKTITPETKIDQTQEDLTNSEYEAYLEDLFDLNIPLETSAKTQPEPIIDSVTPINVPLQGIFKHRTLKNFDPFGHQKEEAFNDNVEQMCLITNRLSEMVTETDRDKIRQNLILLLKLCLWSNKQDLSLSMGSTVSSLAVDPVQLVNELNEQILADESTKAIDSIFADLDKINEKNSDPDVKSSDVIFDIVCDNAGYEFFMDLCLAYFLINLTIVNRVRLHVKQIPWYVSDTTPKDVQYVINGCKTASFTKELNLPSSKETEIELKDFKSTQRLLTSTQLNVFGSKCEEYVNNGTILIQSDDYWTSPCVYKNMKTIDPELYEKLQQPVAILFKGDLNYRKLLADRNWVPTTEFEIGLEGFHPAPIIAARTVKCKLICGLTPAALERANRCEHDWMETGEFGQTLSMKIPSKKLQSNKSGIDSICNKISTVCGLLRMRIVVEAPYKRGGFLGVSVRGEKA
ncbi:Putative protein-glutamate O-methyltransferase [Eumeta japonica]|uniref:Sugar phosphate phosphatase n=1 Tax=Eumeta variegata TaxID=151549 RepID=A0A4C1YGP6_EUMVA|nr:Putative protein-glutamate O-methyltransferase [Eumeta japonica]